MAKVHFLAEEAKQIGATLGFEKKIANPKH